MKKKVEEVARIRSGMYSKTKNNGEVYYIQARSFDEQKKLSGDIMPSLIRSKQIEKHLLKEGDVLVVAKGFDNFAAVYSDDYKPAVASSIFMILHSISKKVVLPEFLAWYINQPQVRDYLRRSAKGSNLPSISKQTLGNIEIEIPTIERQELILKVNDLFVREKQLKNRVSELKEKLIFEKLFKAIRNG